MTPTNLDAIEARLAAATPGRWRDLPMGSDGSVVLAGGNTARTSRRVARCGEFSDAALIAHAPEDLAALVAEVRTLRAVAEAAEEVIGERGPSIGMVTADAIHHLREALDAWRGGEQ